jgi:hypothetical protein
LANCSARPKVDRHSGAREARTSDAQLRIGESDQWLGIPGSTLRVAPE